MAREPPSPLAMPRYVQHRGGEEEEEEEEEGEEEAGRNKNGSRAGEIEPPSPLAMPALRAASRPGAAPIGGTLVRMAALHSRMQIHSKVIVGRVRPHMNQYDFGKDLRSQATAKESDRCFNKLEGCRGSATFTSPPTP